MEEYDFTVEHRPGVRHVNADAISRHPCTVKSCVCKEHQSEDHLVVKSVSAIGKCTAATSDANPTDDTDAQFWSLEGLCVAQRSDPDVSYVLSLMENSAEKPPWDSVACQSEDIRILWGMWPRLRIWNGVLQKSFQRWIIYNVAGDLAKTDEARISVCRSWRNDWWSPRSQTDCCLYSSEGILAHVVIRLGHILERMSALCSVPQGVCAEEGSSTYAAGWRVLVSCQYRHHGTPSALVKVQPVYTHPGGSFFKVGRGHPSEEPHRSNSRSCFDGPYICQIWSTEAITVRQKRRI